MLFKLNAMIHDENNENQEYDLTAVIGMEF